jgi:hypothetical protein
MLKCATTVVGARAMMQDVKKSLQNVYREGTFTRALGRPNANNPHPLRTTEHFLWEQGWRLIDRTHAEREADQLGAMLAANYSPAEKPSNVSPKLLLITIALTASAGLLWAAAYASSIR